MKRAVAGLVGAAALVAMGGGAARAAAPVAALERADPRSLEEVTRDLQRFTEAVREYRGTARGIIKRTYSDKVREVNEKYEPQIDANEREAKEFLGRLSGE